MKMEKLQTHPERFPNGLKCVADYIHSKGLKAGIYSMPEVIPVALFGTKTPMVLG